MVIKPKRGHAEFRSSDARFAPLDSRQIFRLNESVLITFLNKKSVLREKCCCTCVSLTIRCIVCECIQLSLFTLVFAG